MQRRLGGLAVGDDLVEVDHRDHRDAVRAAVVQRRAVDVVQIGQRHVGRGDGAESPRQRPRALPGGVGRARAQAIGLAVAEHLGAVPAGLVGRHRASDELALGVHQLDGLQLAVLGRDGDRRGRVDDLGVGGRSGGQFQLGRRCGRRAGRRCPARQPWWIPRSARRPLGCRRRPNWTCTRTRPGPVRPAAAPLAPRSSSAWPTSVQLAQTTHYPPISPAARRMSRLRRLAYSPLPAVPGQSGACHKTLTAPRRTNGVPGCPVRHPIS